MPVPPWDVSYDVWGVGPPLDLIDKEKKMHVRMLVSIPLLTARIDIAFAERATYNPITGVRRIALWGGESTWGTADG
eukprot:13275105-Alexandrium_andersonii.AAC.1